MMLHFNVLLCAALFSRDALAATYEEYEAVVDYNEATNRRHGYAIYGFWGGIVLFGTLYRIWSLFRLRRSSRQVEDNEAQGRRASLAAKGHANIITPAAFGTHHSRLLYWCTIPTRVELTVIVAYWILTLILVAVGYKYIDYDEYIAPSRFLPSSTL